jgi:hypothetical protein
MSKEASKYLYIAGRYSGQSFFNQSNLGEEICRSFDNVLLELERYVQEV